MDPDKYVKGCLNHLVWFSVALAAVLYIVVKFGGGGR